ncbi:SusC/RagA family TonB-linked outer membrane protein [Maribellus maritimus]|uniref:SusC/RagA family TonB-linked outer membrane protein n=1 Tax=Maribellus maritimus TaxID=2870838 RepID=UPI001EEAB96D|nr:SusC/RagA family TonB-linked outer membrane protein [Maribellus maritimus]MCG6186316.1 SusC/RagA family TonB-linked outer membrane protein [Maribellus maritimus]
MKRALILIYLVLFTAICAFAQNRMVSGTVTSSENGERMVAVTISVKGTGSGTITGQDGTFTLEVPASGTLVASFIGMKTVEVPLTNSNVYDFVLEPENVGIDEVVVTALGITREKKTLGYAVQNLSSEEMNMANDANIVNSLSGKVAGVQVTSGGSTIGASSRIVIRGNASFSGNQPLFVVDGTPIDNSTTNLSGAGGVDWGNTASDIDPNNIESMTVLKGASASALYGSRATNGVILITTKKGNKDKRKIGVDVISSVIFDKASYFPNLQNEYGGGWDGSEYIYNKYNEENGTSLSYNDYAKQFSYNYVDGDGGGVNDSWPINWGPRLDAGLLLDQWSTGPDSPWVSRPDNIKQWFETGVNVENSVALSANGEKASGRVTFTNRNSTGIVNNTDQKQNSIAVNLRLTPSEKITTVANFTYLRKESDNIPNNGYSWADIFGWLQRDYPTQYVKDLFYEKGNEDYIFPSGDNPFYTQRNLTGFSRDRVYGNVSVTYNFTSWLYANARVGVDFYNEYRSDITQSGTVNNIRRGRGGQFADTQIYTKETNGDFTLNFDKAFGDIRIDGLVGANYRNDQYKNMNMAANDLTVPDLYTISNVKGNPTVSMYKSEYETNSLYFAANASYKDYLFLGITGRNDWSSTLPAENRSYFYPSASLGFSVTDAFSVESDLLSYAKLRASIAKVGGDTGPYQLARTYNAGSYNSISTFSPTSTMPPVALKPEETSSYEFGVDMRLLNDRISLDFTYYDQTTVNQILSVATSSATGYQAMRLNAGEIENKGVELMVSGRVLDYTSGLKWDVTVNWATNKSMVNSLYGDLESYQISSGFGGATSLGIPGEEWGVLWGLPFVRNDDGDVVVDSRGIPKTTSVAQKLGTVTPDWTGGITNSFRYKGVNLSFLIDVRVGGDIFSTTAWHSYPTGTYAVTTANHVREEGLIVNGVFEDGTPNDIRVSAQDYYGGAWMWNNHEYSILDGTYVKFRELVLGYDFNLQKVKWIQKFNVSLVGRNLAILYRDKSTKDLGIDPEVGLGGGEGGVGFENFQIPTTRSYGLKVNVNF